MPPRPVLFTYRTFFLRSVLPTTRISPNPYRKRLRQNITPGEHIPLTFTSSPPPIPPPVPLLSCPFLARPVSFALFPPAPAAEDAEAAALDGTDDSRTDEARLRATAAAREARRPPGGAKAAMAGCSDIMACFKRTVKRPSAAFLTDASKGLATSRFIV